MHKKYGTILVAVLLIAIGLGSIVWRQALTPDDWLVPYLSEVSTALLAGGLLSILYKVFTEQEQREELRKLFHIHKSVEESGLDEVLAASQNVDFSEFLLRNQSVIVVINDGERWIGNYAVALRARFSRKRWSTVVFMVDPDGPFLPVLAAKVGKTPDEQRTKIRNAWRLLKTEWEASNMTGIVKIFKLRHYPTQTVFLGDSEAIVTLYQSSGGRTNVPVLIVKDVDRDKSFFAFLRNDVARLHDESTELNIDAVE